MYIPTLGLHPRNSYPDSGQTKANSWDSGSYPLLHLYIWLLPQILLTLDSCPIKHDKKKTELNIDVCRWWLCVNSEWFLSYKNAQNCMWTWPWNQVSWMLCFPSCDLGKYMGISTCLTQSFLLMPGLCSIGSLGRNGREEHVSCVFVDEAILTNTRYGLRIKTWMVRFFQSHIYVMDSIPGLDPPLIASSGYPSLPHSLMVARLKNMFCEGPFLCFLHS